MKARGRASGRAAGSGPAWCPAVARAGREHEQVVDEAGQGKQGQSATIINQKTRVRKPDLHCWKFLCRLWEGSEAEGTVGAERGAGWRSENIIKQDTRTEYQSVYEVDSISREETENR